MSEGIELGIYKHKKKNKDIFDCIAKVDPWPSFACSVEGSCAARSITSCKPCN